MTKEEILSKVTVTNFSGVEFIKPHNCLQAIEEYANLRLSEQQSKHEQEMKEFLDWTYKNGWRHSVTPNFFIRVEYPDIVEERVTFTELLTKFKNR